MPTAALPIFGRQRRLSQMPGGYFHLEEEKTKTRVFGYGHGDHIKLSDEYGNIWRGSANRNPDNSVIYRFRNAKGKTLSGVSNGNTVTLRDERGSTWKGFVD
jgi:hypothetical protein